MSLSATSSSLAHGRAAALVAVIVLSIAGTPAGRALDEGSQAGSVHPTLDEALKLCFDDARIERGTVYLTEEQLEQAARLAGEPIASAIVHPYVARRDGQIIGTAWVDSHRVRTLRETILVVVDPEQRVRRVELLAFGEPPEYVPRGAWYGQFDGRRLDDELRLQRGIRGVTGATLTARATTAAVRRVLSVHRVLNGPPPTPEPRREAKAIAPRVRSRP